MTIKTLVESERKFTSAHHQQVILGNWCEAANGQEIFLGAIIVIWSWDIEKYSHPTPISNSEEFLTRFILYNYRYTIPPPECWWCRKRFLHIRALCLLPYISLSPSICPIDVKMSLVAQLKLSKKKGIYKLCDFWHTFLKAKWIFWSLVITKRNNVKLYFVISACCDSGFSWDFSSE